ncbi:MAG: hypothetical protein QNL04_00700 [SAR324 cluster bacterium]|nr:hypothetical protein [SAR324 cluster bacterium]
MQLLLEKSSFTTEISLGNVSAKVTLNVVDASSIQTIVDKHTKTKYKQGVKKETMDHIAIRAERFCKILEDWEDITDRTGKAIPCTYENKKKIADLNFDFVQAIFDAAEGYGQTLNEEEIKKAGN